MGKAFPSLQSPRPNWRRVFRYPFKRGTPPQRPRRWPLVSLIALIAGASLVSRLGILDPSYQDPGPVKVTVQEVIDGDTIRIDPVTWLDKKPYSRVRFETFSAPEIGNKAKCDHEAQLGRQAKIRLARILQPGVSVYLFDGRPGHYPHRLIAQVRTAAGESFDLFLIHAGLAVPYSRGGPPDWCSGS